jgi:ABC-type spermidine/putrescine transport system permease subunit I
VDTASLSPAESQLDGGDPVAVNRRVPAYRRDSRLLILPALLFQIMFFFVPLVMVARESVFDPDFTGVHYGEVFTNPVYRKVLLQTLRLALIVTAFSVALGYPVAYFIARARPLVAAIALLGVLVPLWTSLLARTYSFQVLYGREGFVNRVLIATGVVDEPLGLMFNGFTAVSGMVHALLPFVILPCLAVMRGIDRSYTDAAKSLGASPWRAFRHVYFPMAKPGLVTATILTFILALGFFVTPVVLGGTSEFTIAGLIQLQMQRTLNWGLGGALSVMLLLFTGIIVYLYQRRYGFDRLIGAGR